MKTNISRMINSILKCNQKQVSIDKIITADRIINDPEEIKQATKDHFNNWTKHNPTNPDFEHEWTHFLQPLPHINPNIYSELTQQITMSELTETINSSPLHKATGPSGISNEMLQHLPVIGKQILLNIFNACLSIEKTPNSWGHANLWAISKKQHYNNDLTYT